MNKLLISAVLVTLAVFGILFVFKSSFIPSATPTPVPTEQAKVSQVVNVEVLDKKYENVEFRMGQTALDVTKSVAQVETQGEGELAFVTQIDDRQAEENKKEFWSFYINGKQAEVGAGTYKVQPGDVIGWKIETY